MGDTIFTVSGVRNLNFIHCFIGILPFLRSFLVPFYIDTGYIFCVPISKGSAVLHPGDWWKEKSDIDHIIYSDVTSLLIEYFGDVCSDFIVLIVNKSPVFSEGDRDGQFLHKFWNFVYRMKLDTKHVMTALQMTGDNYLRLPQFLSF